MSDVKIEIDRSHTDGAFTNYDIIKGNVTLVVTKAITLNWIQVKLEGESTTQLLIPKFNNNKKKKEKDKIIQDIHKVLYDTTIVFPPDNVRQVSQAKEFTLAPGNYSYPFEFKIPLTNSCVKRGGITNMIHINKKTFDIMINNGNFNSDFVKHKAQKYYKDYVAGGQQQQQQRPEMPALPNELPYHVTTQLPPSLSGMGNFANIKYYVKVTCKRSSFFKTNLRAFDPFTFLPLDLDSQYRPIEEQLEQYKEAFVRKEIIFRNKIPSIVGVEVPQKTQLVSQASQASQIQPKKQGFLQRWFSSDLSYNTPNNNTSGHMSRKNQLMKYPKITPVNVPFSFEIRFRHPAFLTPGKLPTFKLYLVSTVNPLQYSLDKYGEPEESNGLGVVYLQNITVSLISTTSISIVENDSGMNEFHMGNNVQTIPICDNSYSNLKFDLMKCRKNKNSLITTTRNSNDACINNKPVTKQLYELEIPQKYFANCILPENLPPSFKTCNISRSYDLIITAKFSPEKITITTTSSSSPTNSASSNMKEVELRCSNIKVLSGLHFAGAPITQRQASVILSLTPPPAPALAPAAGSRSGSAPVAETQDSLGQSSKSESFTNEGDENLPTYDEVVIEHNYQDISEHQRARRRYQEFGI